MNNSHKNFIHFLQIGKAIKRDFEIFFQNSEIHNFVLYQGRSLDKAFQIFFYLSEIHIARIFIFLSEKTFIFLLNFFK